jgi:hypothetical protein
MYQNGVALHTANRMLDEDADWAQDLLGNLLGLAQVRVGGLWTLARFLRRDVDPIAMVVRLNTQIASIDPHMDICKPIQIRGALLFQHGIVVIVTTKGTPKKNDQLVRQRHDRVLQRLLFFFRCHAHAASPHLGNDDTPVRGPQSGGDPRRATPLSTPPVSTTPETASDRDGPGYRTASAIMYAGAHGLSTAP